MMSEATATSGSAPAAGAAVAGDAALELSNAGRGVWLVKLPKYMAAVWERAPSDMEVGRLRISRGGPGRAQVSLALSEEARALHSTNKEQSLPRDHRLDVSTVTRQTLGVFSHQGTTPGADADRLYMEGRIVQKLECRPYADNTYMKLKKESILQASVPHRQVQQYDKIVQNFKPVSDHRHNIKYKEIKKQMGKKARDDKDAVLNMLFAAFEKHQYYNIKDLQKITRQPIVYLKEILKEVCNYNLKNPHKNMWELKPEYRYYKQETAAAKAEEEAADSD